MSREDDVVEGAGQPPRFARLLNRLFLTRLTAEPNGIERPYTLREVAQATGISIAYLSEARRGGIENPSSDKVELLAAFFGVRPGYFFGEPEQDAREPNQQIEGGSPELRHAMREALEEPLLGEIVMRAGALSAVERSMLLEILHKVEEVARLRSALSTRKTEQRRGRRRDDRSAPGEGD